MPYYDYWDDEFNPWRDISHFEPEAIIDELIKNGIKPAVMLVQGIIKQNEGKYVHGDVLHALIQSKISNHPNLEPYGMVIKTKATNRLLSRKSNKKHK